jgi:predicted YcjX-like family ATPase
MKHSFQLALVLHFLAALLLAQPAQDTPPRASLQELATTIRAELETHGDRVLGHDTYRWTTRLEKVSDCRAELTVRIVSNLGTSTVRTESINFSLGALEPNTIDLQKSWLDLPCAGKEKCVFSTATCSTRTKDGMVTDCATASQKRVDSFALQFDGDSVAASRLERAFHQAIELCREPQSVTF